MRTPTFTQPGNASKAAYFFLAPFLLLFLGFTVYPLGKAVVLTFQQTYGPGTSVFVGLDNFKFLLADPRFWKALSNTTFYAVASVLVQMPVALGLALLLNHPQVRGKAIFRLIFFSPSLVGIVFVAMLFGLIFEKRTGLLNGLLHAWFGFDLEFPWLEAYTMPAMIIAGLWMYAGFNMIYFLAALQSVDKTLLEAAEIDGAGPWQRFRHVIFPHILPVTTFVIILSLIGSFQLFELPYILLEGPGSEDRGLTIVMYLFQTGFEVGDLGYASAIGWALTFVLLVFGLAQLRLSQRK
jgi:ABC-type sugar transport system permease subunit